MTVHVLKEESALELARAFAACLKPGPHGEPLIEEWNGASFVARGSVSGLRFRVTVEELDTGKTDAAC